MSRSVISVRGDAQRRAPVLWALLALFAFRVAAQPVQARFDLPLLPPAAAWASGALPYGVLLAVQLALLAVGGWTAARFSRGRVRPRRVLGAWLLALAAAYFGLMAARLALGLTVLASHPWFGKPVPALFHLVLAGFVLVVGDYHWRRGEGETT